MVKPSLSKYNSYLGISVNDAVLLPTDDILNSPRGYSLTSNRGGAADKNLIFGVHKSEERMNRRICLALTAYTECSVALKLRIMK